MFPLIEISRPLKRLSMGLITFGASALPAQSPDSMSARYSTWDVTPFIAYAQNSPTGDYWGRVPDVGHRMLGVRLETPVLRLGDVQLTYSPNAVPVVVLTHIPQMSGTVCKIIKVFQPPQCELVYSRHESVIGSTISPLGVGARRALGARSAIQVDAAAGVGFFKRTVPVPGARRVNVVLEWGGSISHQINSRNAIQAGYRFHHISNAYTHKKNPGVDANLFSIGWKLNDAARGIPIIGDTRVWEILPYAGFAPSANVGGGDDTAPGVKIVSTGIQFSTPVLHTREFVISYNGNISPATMVTGIPKKQVSVYGSGTVIGAGVSPFGLSVSTANPSRFDFSVSGSIGGALFSGSLPVDEAEKIKVVLEGGPRISYRVSENRSLQAGVKLYRSRSSFALPENPRIDATMFYVGLGWRKPVSLRSAK